MMEITNLRRPYHIFFSACILVLTVATQVVAAPKLIDLTHPFDEKTIYWPTSKSFHMEPVFSGITPKGFWYEANNFATAEHGGTHVDAPAHFAEGKWHIDDIPLNRLIAPGVLVDVSHKTLNDPDYLIQVDDFLAWEKMHGKIPSGTIVLVACGWEKFWPDKRSYLGTDKKGDVENLHFPGFSPEAAAFLAQDRKVFAIGLDTPSIDRGQSKDFLAHRVFGKANVPGFESIRNLHKLPAKGFRVIALPMKIGDGSGAPLRIVAEIP